jgi:hypothetical protein
MKALYIAWQDPQTRYWYTVGRLSRENGMYRFTYTQGALRSQRFKYLGRMHNLRQIYWSHELFPLFSNRILDSSRPEYPEYLQWLALDSKNQNDPLQLLARSGGKRATDELCVYPHPEINERGEIELFFLSHGLRYLNSSALQRINQLKSGDHLMLRRENENAHDRYALLLETDEPVTVGYCPRYLSRDLCRVMETSDVKLTVERVNQNAPIQFRLLCRAVFTPPLGFDMFADDEHQPLVKESVAA